MTISKKEQTALIAVIVGVGVLLSSVSGYYLFRPGKNGTAISGSDSSTVSATGSQGGSEMTESIIQSGSQAGQSDGSSGGSAVSNSGSHGASSASSTPSAASRFVWPKPDRRATSEIKTVNGTPKMYVNGKMVPPILFFGNTDMNARSEVLTEEFKKAAKGNIHLHSIISSPEIGSSNPPEVQYFDMANDLDTMIQGDPNGFALLRVNVGKYYNTSSYPKSDIVQYAGSRAQFNPMVSIASDLWFEQAKSMLKAMVTYIRKDAVYSKHVMGYHLECGEWFQYMFRENGADLSPANTKKFREWLKTKYQSDANLKKAWGDSLASLSTAKVPEDLPGNLSGVPESLTLMLKTTDRKYTDYLDYIGDLVSSRIDGLAGAIKEAGNRENIVIAFYGYLFELADPESGHFSLEKLLKSKNIDGLASPECYLDRNYNELFPKQAPGGTGAYMTAVDSVLSAGKMWFVESDQRTFINRAEASTEHDTYLVPIQSVGEIIEVAKRDIGSNLVHGAGIWFMDLWSVGWLDDQAIWDSNGKLAELYQAYSNYRKKSPQLDVAFIVDEKAMSLVSQPTDSAWHFLSYQRYDFYRAGIRWGMYTMKDVLNGNLSGAKVLFFLTPFRLSTENVNKIKQIAAGKTLVFSYGFGSTIPQDVSLLTGMKIVQVDGKGPLQMTVASGAGAIGLQSKTVFGTAVNANPKWVVESGADSVIGKYQDGKTGFAIKNNGSYKTVFFGGMRMDTDVIRAIVKYAGNTPVFTESDDVTMANENLLVIHSSKNGVKTLTFPSKCDVYDYFHNQWYLNVSSFKISMNMGETLYFFYGKKSEIEAMKLPVW